MTTRVAAVLAVALGLVAAVLPAGPAAASCYNICDGADPAQARYENANGAMVLCGDARTIYTVDPTSAGYVELRYSRNCRMAWARGVSANGGSMWVEGFNADGSFRVAYWTANWRVLSYSAAVNDAGLTARVCISSPGGYVECGRRY
jgi:hypothetical protein